MGKRWDWWCGRTPSQLAKQAQGRAEIAKWKAGRRKPTEYKRTCQRCNRDWYLPAELALEKPPSGRERAAVGLDRAADAMLDAAAALGTGSGARPLSETARVEERAERVLRNSRCPGCGSVSYHQTAVVD